MHSSCQSHLGTEVPSLCLPLGMRLWGAPGGVALQAVVQFQCTVSCNIALNDTEAAWESFAVVEAGLQGLCCLHAHLLAFSFCP